MANHPATDWSRVRLGPSPDARSQEFGGEVVLVNLKRGDHFGLDGVVRILGAATPSQAPYAEALRAEAQGLGLDAGGALDILDPGTRVAELLPAVDVFVLTSVAEGVPTTVLEAMACGIPVVATDVGAVRDVVEDGATGLLVSPSNPRGIASAVLRILGDPALHAQMGGEARRRAVEWYDVDVCADVHVQAFEAAVRRGSRRHSMGVAECSRADSAPDLWELLVCPACRGSLTWSEAGASCLGCVRGYPIVDGIPVMLFDPASAGHDELDHHHRHGDDHKHQQAEFFDRTKASEFETVRPHGTPRLHEWLLEQKFRFSRRGIGSSAVGDLALTVCGGSGMDAEFLARAGYRVISSDISLGAAKRARERAGRFGLSLASVVADIEHLPFADESVDLVYVHDGLHHLERPELGVSEMARVAARAVSITEPARAAATALAVRFRLALEQEEAGNRVARLTSEELKSWFKASGLHPTFASRYAMYYGHEPGWPTKLLSMPGLYSLVRPGWRLANALVGRWGNKVTVQGVRPR